MTTEEIKTVGGMFDRLSSTLAATGRRMLSIDKDHHDAQTALRLIDEFKAALPAMKTEAPAAPAPAEGGVA